MYLSTWDTCPFILPYTISVFPFLGMDKAPLSYSALRAEGGDNVSVLTYCSELTPSQSACTNVCITYIHHNEQGKTIQTSWNS